MTRWVSVGLLLVALALVGSWAAGWLGRGEPVPATAKPPEPDDGAGARPAQGSVPERRAPPSLREALRGAGRAFDAPRGGSTAELLARARDEHTEPTARLQSIRALAAECSDEGVAGLELLASELMPDLAAAAGQALGGCGSAGAAIRRLLGSDLPRAVRVAVLRGLGEGRDPTWVDELRAVVRDSAQPLAARAALFDAYRAAASPGLREALLGGIANLPRRDTERFFREELARALAGGEAQVVLEATGRAGHPALLLELGLASPSAELRAAAADALGDHTLGTPEQSRLARAVVAESESEPRGALLDALAQQVPDLRVLPESAALVAAIRAEAVPGVRLSGARLLAASARAGDPVLAALFDGEFAPWLEASAHGERDRLRVRLPVDTLYLAGTPAARQALERLARSPDPDTAGAAERALSRLVDGS